MSATHRSEPEDEGLNIEVVKSNYSANIIARAELMGQGFVKAVFHQDKIIGAVIVGDHAAELISPLALAVSNELTRKQLRVMGDPAPDAQRNIGDVCGRLTKSHSLKHGQGRPGIFYFRGVLMIMAFEAGLASAGALKQCYFL